MKKLGTLALTLTLAGAMTLPALAAEDATPVSGTSEDNSSVPMEELVPATVLPENPYATALTLNGEALDTAAIPAASDPELLPMRLVTEADHGSVYWSETDNESWFTLGDNRIVVNFADNSVTLNDAALEGVTAEVVSGVTFLPADVLTQLEGYTVTGEGDALTITTPNNDPMVKTAYQIREESGMAYGMRSDNAEVATLFQLPEDTFEQAICFTSMNTTPDIMVLAKLADGADEAAVKEALEAHRQSQHDTFSWYLSQNLPKVEDARILVEDGYVFYLIAENADAGEAAFHAYVETQA